MLLLLLFCLFFVFIKSLISYTKFSGSGISFHVDTFILLYIRLKLCCTPFYFIAKCSDGLYPAGKMQKVESENCVQSFDLLKQTKLQYGEIFTND